MSVQLQERITVSESFSERHPKREVLNADFTKIRFWTALWISVSVGMLLMSMSLCGISVFYGFDGFLGGEYVSLSCAAIAVTSLASLFIAVRTDDTVTRAVKRAT